jgi:hypothetical protein
MPSDSARTLGPPALFPEPGLSSPVFFPALSGVTVGRIGAVVGVAVAVLVGVAVGVGTPLSIGCVGCGMTGGGVGLGAGVGVGLGVGVGVSVGASVGVGVGVVVPAETEYEEGAAFVIIKFPIKPYPEKKISIEHIIPIFQCFNLFFLVFLFI